VSLVMAYSRLLPPRPGAPGAWGEGEQWLGANRPLTMPPPATNAGAIAPIRNSRTRPTIAG